MITEPLTLDDSDQVLTLQCKYKYIARVELFRFRSRGGVKLPTGGKELILSPRAPLRVFF